MPERAPAPATVFCLAAAAETTRSSQETTATAVLLFHRLMITQDLAAHSERKQIVLVTCTFLAGKLMETPRGLRDVINCLHVLADAAPSSPGEGAASSVRAEPPQLNQAHWTLRERVVECEQAILRSIGFDVGCEHPYR